MSRPDRSLYFTLAHRYVTAAIYHGDLPRLDGSVACVDCGRAAEEYDHRDYKKPMEVEPVCKACNATGTRLVEQYIELERAMRAAEGHMRERDYIAAIVRAA